MHKYLEVGLHSQKVTSALTDVSWTPVRFPVRAHAWIAGQAPGWGHARGNRWIFLYLSFSRPSL